MYDFVSKVTPITDPYSFSRMKALGPAHTHGEENEATLFKKTRGNGFVGIFYDRRSWALGSGVCCALSRSRPCEDQEKSPKGRASSKRKCFAAATSGWRLRKGTTVTRLSEGGGGGRGRGGRRKKVGC